MSQLRTPPRAAKPKPLGIDVRLALKCKACGEDLSVDPIVTFVPGKSPGPMLPNMPKSPVDGRTDVIDRHTLDWACNTLREPHPVEYAAKWDAADADPLIDAMDEAKAAVDEAARWDERGKTEYLRYAIVTPCPACKAADPARLQEKAEQGVSAAMRHAGGALFWNRPI